MDGTHTEPRQIIDQNMIDTLAQVTRSGHDVGIVTGSPMNYMEEQIGPLLSAQYSEIDRYHLLPCNGIEYTFWENGISNATVGNTMAEELGTSNFQNLMAALVHLQAEVSKTMLDRGLSLTGNFIQYRGGLINWCPIGRNATQPQRAAFVNFDQTTNFRNEYCRLIKKWLSWAGLEDKMTVVKGGSTSFDIYPAGWDKTYALTWFGDYECWFVGDKCHPGGNDQQIYELLQKNGKAFETTGPNQTIEIIDNILNTLGPDSSAG